MNNNRSVSPVSLIIIVAGLLVPQIAWANSISAFAFFAYFHLLIGNLIIGLVEGVLVSRLLKAGVLRSIAWMIIANYVSALAGLGILKILDTLRFSFVDQFTFNHLTLSIGIGITGLFLLSAFLEAPFVYLVQYFETRSARRAIGFSFIAQSLSYSMIVPFYMSFTGGENLTSDWKIEKRDGLADLNGYLLYYDKIENAVRRLDL